MVFWLVDLKANGKVSSLAVLWDESKEIWKVLSMEIQ